MLPAEWAERHDSGAASQWTHALMRDERGIHLLCSCMLYANFRSRSATQVRERERERVEYRDAKVANRTREGFRVGDRSRGRFATPADSPLHDCSPCSHVHVRRGSLGFVHRSRTNFCRPVPNLGVTIRNFCIALQWHVSHSDCLGIGLAGSGGAAARRRKALADALLTLALEGAGQTAVCSMESYTSTSEVPALCGIAAGVTRLGPPREALYTVALRGLALRGGMAAAVRWWWSTH
jgi:hypothetical protein